MTLFSVCALGASGLLSCSNELAETSAPESGQGTRVEVTASVGESPLALTRGADGLNSASGFSKQTSALADSKVHLCIDDGAYSYADYIYTITGATALTPPATPPYFPAGKTAVNVYGWYPATDDSKVFTVKDNQQSDNDYCLSDLMVTKTPKQSTRSLNESTKTWDVTPAGLQFDHVMSKVKVVVTPAEGVTVTDVKLISLKKQTTITTTPASGQVTGVSAVTKDDGTSGDITLLTGGNIGSTTPETQRTFCGVFPDQSKSGDFLAVTATFGGFSSTITYTLGASAKTFAQNQQYNIAVEVGRVLTDQSVSIADWATKTTEPLEVPFDWLTDPAAMDPATILKNPLYYVAQYNLATIKGVNDLSGSPAAETTFCTDHNIMGSATSPALMFTQADALLTKAGGTGALSGWHLPDVKEQIAVVPSNSTSASGSNIWELTSTDAANPSTMNEATCTIAGTDVTSSVNSVFLCVANGNANSSDPNYRRYYDHYAVRFINTDYASAWHYVWTGNGMLIESYMLKVKPTTLDEAKRVLAALPTSSAWQATRNYAPLTSGTPATTTSLCYRYLPACGHKHNGTGAAQYAIGFECVFWSSSQSGDNGFHWRIHTNYGSFHENPDRNTFGFSVRLFRDH